MRHFIPMLFVVVTTLSFTACDMVKPDAMAERQLKSWVAQKHTHSDIITKAYEWHNFGGWHANAVYEIAKLAHENDRDVAFLDRIFQLSIGYLGETESIVDLARMAVSEAPDLEYISQAVNEMERDTTYVNYADALAELKDRSQNN